MRVVSSAGMGAGEKCSSLCNMMNFLVGFSILPEMEPAPLASYQPSIHVGFAQFPHGRGGMFRF